MCVCVCVCVCVRGVMGPSVLSSTPLTHTSGSWMSPAVLVVAGRRASIGNLILQMLAGTVHACVGDLWWVQLVHERLFFNLSPTLSTDNQYVFFYVGIKLLTSIEYN